MFAEDDKKWGVVPPDTINADEDGWTDCDLARDIAPGGVLHEWAMARLWEGVAKREAEAKEQEMQWSRAMNDKKRIESDAARSAKARFREATALGGEMAPPGTGPRVILPKPTRRRRRSTQSAHSEPGLSAGPSRR